MLEAVRFPLGKTVEDIFIMHRLFDNANQVYVIFRVLGGFIAYVFSAAVDGHSLDTQILFIYVFSCQSHNFSAFRLHR